jgi:hypothetical protein
MKKKKQITQIISCVVLVLVSGLSLSIKYALCFYLSILVEMIPSQETNAMKDKYIAVRLSQRHMKNTPELHMHITPHPSRKSN